MRRRPNSSNAAWGTEAWIAGSDFVLERGRACRTAGKTECDGPSQSMIEELEYFLVRVQEVVLCWVVVELVEEQLSAKDRESGQRQRKKK